MIHVHVPAETFFIIFVWQKCFRNNKVHKNALGISRISDRFHLALFNVLHFLHLRYDLEAYNRVFPQPKEPFCGSVNYPMNAWRTTEEPCWIVYKNKSITLVQNRVPHAFVDSSRVIQVHASLSFGYCLGFLRVLQVPPTSQKQHRASETLTRVKNE